MKEFQYVIKDEAGNPRKTGGNAWQKRQRISNRKLPLWETAERPTRCGLMAVMSLGLKQGAEMTVRVEGEDEEQAAEAMKAFLEANL